MHSPRRNRSRHLPPETFTMTKRQIRQPLIDRMAKTARASMPATKKILDRPGDIALVHDYVAKTFKKAYG